MPSFLIVKTSSLGDVIHMMPALSDMRRACPGAHISWLVDEAYAPIAELHPAVDKVVPVAWRRWRHCLGSAATWREMRAFAANLRSRRYDAIVDTQGLMHSAAMARLAIGPRYGYDATSIREPIAAAFYDVRHSVSRRLPAIERNRRLTALALKYHFAEKVDYGLAATRLGAPRPVPYALFLHGTSQPRKMWPMASWLEVGNMLGLRGLRVVLPAGSVAERERATELAEALPHAEVPPTLPLAHTRDLILSASLVVGVDTGLLHLAAACGVPTVGIFAGSDPALTGPVGDGPIAIAGSKDEPATAQAVIAAADEVLARAAFASTAETESRFRRAGDILHGDVAHLPVTHIAAGGRARRTGL